MELVQWAGQLNAFGAARKACFFLIDFERERPAVWPAGAEGSPYFAFPGKQFLPPASGEASEIPPLRPFAVDQLEFRRAFDIVQRGLRRGDSFLTNLTFPTPVLLRGSYRAIFERAEAKYRLWWPEHFVCFSPETFVTVSDDGYLESRPMKGTAEDSPEGRHYLLTSAKEIAEHATIVDLIRNDLSRVARGVRVTDYRYLRPIASQAGALLQTSSKIGGWLPDDWRDRLGDILNGLLPAGSVSGAPKPATLDLIRAAEGGPRGYYCGVAGYFDGETLDSCVLIRFLEPDGRGGHLFRSGGGITARSNWRDEYDELQHKIRIPLRPSVPS